MSASSASSDYIVQTSPQAGTAKPFLRWAGSKRALLPELQSKLPDAFDRYVEPFAGSACLFFRISPKRAVLADLNEELIRTYETVRDLPDDVGLALAGMPVSRDDYYAIRAQRYATEDRVGCAARFIYLNRFCFNGLFRTNMKGEFNVPFGRPKNGNVPTTEALRACAEQLKKAELRSGDFESVIISDLKVGDLVYLDPPYCQSDTRIFREYHPESFKKHDLRRLQSLLVQIDASGAKFIVSYGSSEDTNALFTKWNSQEVSVQRNISGFAKHRGKASEIIVTNY